MKLVKSSVDKVMFGVCGGVARYFGWDTTIVRLIFVLATIFGVGSPIIIYLVLLFLMPDRG